MRSDHVTPIPKAGTRRGRSLYKQSQRIVMERSQGRCEAAIEGVCTGRANQTHHIRRRSQGGSDLPENLLAVDDACHQRIHERPLWANEMGFLKSSSWPLSSAVLSVEPVE